MDNVYIITSDGELRHHGVKGMKWGIRRYQNPDGSLTTAGRKRRAREATKELNALDKEATEHVSNVIRYDAAAKRRGAKITNADDIVTDKKFRDAVAKRDAAKEALADVDSRTWKKIGELIEEGYDVSNERIIRYAKTGERYATQFLTGIIGNTAVTAVQAGRYGNNYQSELENGRTLSQTPWMVQGNKYKVR